VKKYILSGFSSLLLVLLPILFTSFWVALAVRNETVVQAWPWYYWVLITLGTSVTSALALSPPTYLAVVFGYFLSYWAIMPVFIINVLAIYLIYIVVHWLPTDRWFSFIYENKKALKMIEKVKTNELKVVFFLKLSPVLPFTLTNIALALSGAKLRNILLGGVFGMIPRTILAVWTGTQAKVIQEAFKNPEKDQWQQQIIILLLVVSLVGLIQTFWKKK
jgi:uncharacterized membrane protein YdjX (TVP38/TMEM64 family)